MNEKLKDLFEHTTEGVIFIVVRVLRGSNGIIFLIVVFSKVGQGPLKQN